MEDDAKNCRTNRNPLSNFALRELDSISTSSIEVQPEKEQTGTHCEVTGAELSPLEVRVSQWPKEYKEMALRLGRYITERIQENTEQDEASTTSTRSRLLDWEADMGRQHNRIFRHDRSMAELSRSVLQWVNL